MKRSSDPPEVCDVTAKVAIYGIFNPFNFHSYRSVYFTLLPVRCDQCGENVYPFSRVVLCLRCSSYSHRQCMRGNSFLCPKNSITTIEALSIKSIDIRHFTKDQQQGKTANSKCTLSKSCSRAKRQCELPLVGTSDCIWQEALASLANGQQGLWRAESLAPRLLPKTGSHNSKSADLGEWELYVRSLLTDSSSLPGRVCFKLHSLFIGITFTSPKECLDHARACLDTIGCALFSVLPDRVTSDSALVIAVFNIVERHTLSISNRSMYKTIMAAVLCMAEFDDLSLRTKIRDRKTDSSMENWPVHEALVSNFGQKISAAVTPKDKLSVLVQFLQEMTSVNAALSSEAHSKRENDDNNCEVIPSCGAAARDTGGADDLIGRLADVISAEICDFGGAISWFAECTFMDFMSRGEAWRVGLEGYALTTFMQTLHSLSAP